MTIDTYVFPFSSINDNDDVFRKDTRIIDIPDVSEQECSMRVIPCQINQWFASHPSDFDEIWHTCR